MNRNTIFVKRRFQNIAKVRITLYGNCICPDLHLIYTQFNRNSNHLYDNSLNISVSEFLNYVQLKWKAPP